MFQLIDTELTQKILQPSGPDVESKRMHSQVRE